MKTEILVRSEKFAFTTFLLIKCSGARGKNDARALDKHVIKFSGPFHFYIKDYTVFSTICLCLFSNKNKTEFEKIYYIFKNWVLMIL